MTIIAVDNIKVVVTVVAFPLSSYDNTMTIMAVDNIKVVVTVVEQFRPFGRNRNVAYIPNGASLLPSAYVQEREHLNQPTRGKII